MGRTGAGAAPLASRVVAAVSMDAMPEPKFAEAPNTATYVCTHVWNDGAPILWVSHDAEGDWQFLCGGVHDDPAQGLLIGLAHVVERDPSVNRVASMCTSHVAERADANGEWTVRDETLEHIREVIDEYGWWVCMIDEEVGQPAFAYTVGLHERFGHDEIIMFGLPLASMHRILNVCGALVREGTRLTHGATSREVLEGYEARFRSVVARESYDTFLGYGSRFYGERGFGVLQCVWPDEAHKFHDEEGAASSLTTAQPMPP
jgi:hypothetical protein